MADFTATENLMSTLFTLFIVLFISTLLLIAFIAVRNFKRLKEHGLDPLAPQSDLMGRIANSELLEPASHDLKHKLEELESLRSSGLISEIEYSELREKILKSFE